MLQSLSQFFLFIYILFQIYSPSKCECNLDTPIKKGSQCLLTKCTESEFASGTCIIDNSIAKVQYLNDIILIEGNYRFPTLAIDDSSGLVLLVSNGGNRVFYGVKKDGRPYFLDDKGKEIYAKKIEATGGIQRNEAIAFFAYANNNKNKQYYVSISENYFEIYDLNNNGKITLSNSKVFLDIAGYWMILKKAVMAKFTGSDNIEKYYFILRQDQLKMIGEI